MIHDSMPCDPILGQGQGRRGPKVVKMAAMHVIKRLTGNYDTPKQYRNFSWTNF